jgi:ribosomal protein L16 Arg81 hydroxylase
MRAPVYEPGLASLIWPLAPDRFLLEYWQRKPLFIRGTAKRLECLRRLFGNFDLDWILRHANLEDTRVQVRRLAAGAKHVAPPSDLDAASLRFLHGLGAQLYLACSSVPGVDEWITALTRDLQKLSPLGRGDVYATHAGGGTGFHFDRNDNFTIQLRGRKEWRYLEEVTVACPVHNRESFPTSYGTRVPAKLSARSRRKARRVVLSPGDFLYIPRGTLHATNAIDESLSFDLCVDPTPWSDTIANALKAHLTRFEAWRASATRDPAAAAALLEHLKEAVAQMRPELLVAPVPKSTGRVTRSSRFSTNPFVTWSCVEADSDREQVALRFDTPGGRAYAFQISRPLLSVLAALSTERTAPFAAQELLAPWPRDEGAVLALLNQLAYIGFVVDVRRGRVRESVSRRPVSRSTNSS